MKNQGSVSAFRLSGLALVMLLAVSCVSAPRVNAQAAIGLGLSLFFDDGTLKNDERIGPLRDTDSDEVSNVSLVAGAIYYLHQVGGEAAESGEGSGLLGGFRLGGELRFLGTYKTETDEDSDGPEELGTLLEVGVRGEYTTLLTPKFGLAFGLRFDLGLLFPSGEFADEIERLADEGVSTSTSPRLGLALIPTVGVRFAADERIGLRFDFGFGWSLIDLFGIDEQVQGIVYQRDASLSSTRVELTVGVEVSL